MIEYLFVLVVESAYEENHRVYIGHLRQKVEGDPSKPRYIITKRGIGYSFEVH